MRVRNTMYQKQHRSNGSARAFAWMCMLALMLLGNQVAFGQNSRVATSDRATYSELTAQYEAAKYAYLQHETPDTRMQFETAQADLNAFESRQLITAKMGGDSQRLTGMASYSDTNVGGPEWDRPFADCSGVSGLGPVRYHLEYFTVSVTGPYDINSVQDNYDGYLFVYENPFDPLNQSDNCVAGDDDGNGGIGTSDIEALTLNAGTQYIIITTGFANGNEGPFTNTVEGPGDISFGLGTDLALEHTAEVDLKGAVGTFTLTVTNNGPKVANDIEVFENLSLVTVTNVSASQGSFANGLWTIGTLEIGAQAVLEFDVQFNVNGIQAYTAEIVGMDLPDSNLSNNTATVDMLINGRPAPDFVGGGGPGGIIDRGGRRFTADLSLTKAVDNANPASGSEVVYTLTVSNSGPQSTRDVEVTDLLPDGLVYVADSTSQGSYDAISGIWTVGALRVGSTAALYLTAEVMGSGTITNTASITGSNLPDPDNFFGFFDEEAEVDDVASVTLTVASPSLVREGAQMMSAYPNPFNPRVVIPFELKDAHQVRIAVYDLLGREVRVLAAGQFTPGQHEVAFDAGDLATGMYLVRMVSGNVSQTQRITLMK